MTFPESHAYYVQSGPMTAIPADPAVAALLAAVPTDLAALVSAVQGAMVHVFWANAYGLELSDERRSEVNLRSAGRMLRRMIALDAAPLGVVRPPGRRLVGNCRDFSVLTAALLRRQGVPARARCGFGTYFVPDHYEDHWVVERWDAAAGRWKLADAQIDALQQEKLGIDFDPLDVPRDRFVVGGRGWQLCRDEGVDPEKFGIFDMKGLWFVRGNLVRDAAALANMELLPWDAWGLIEGTDEAISAADSAFLDGVAALTLGDDAAVADLRALYAEDARLRVPPVFHSYTQAGPIEVTLADAIAPDVVR